MPSTTQRRPRSSKHIAIGWTTLGSAATSETWKPFGNDIVFIASAGVWPFL
jgi:hypothetical protein